MSKPKLDKVTFILNIVLGVLYVPFANFQLIFLMVSEGNEQGDALYNTLISMFCYVIMSIPFLCILSIVLSIIFRKQGKSLWAFFVQFMPIAIFCLALLILL